MNKKSKYRTDVNDQLGKINIQTQIVHRVPSFFRSFSFSFFIVVIMKFTYVINYFSKITIEVQYPIVLSETSISKPKHKIVNDLTTGINAIYNE